MVIRYLRNCGSLKSIRSPLMSRSTWDACAMYSMVAVKSRVVYGPRSMPVIANNVVSVGKLGIGIHITALFLKSSSFGCARQHHAIEQLHLRSQQQVQQFRMLACQDQLVPVNLVQQS